MEEIFFNKIATIARANRVYFRKVKFHFSQKDVLGAIGNNIMKSMLYVSTY